MPVVMHMMWEGVTPEQYEQARKVVNWEGDVPHGALFHVASFDDKGLYVTDLWETEDDFKHFVDTRLMPGVTKVGMQGQPKFFVQPVHALFTPGYGTTSLRPGESIPEDYISGMS